LFTLGLSILQSSHQVVTVVEINLPQSLLRKEKKIWKTKTPAPHQLKQLTEKENTTKSSQLVVII